MKRAAELLKQECKYANYSKLQAPFLIQYGDIIGNLLVNI